MVGRSAPSRTIHVRLYPEDRRPKCDECGDVSQYYCCMNDRYFCSTHVLGHDENE